MINFCTTKGTVLRLDSGNLFDSDAMGSIKMLRQIRKHSSKGIYHIMLRSINQQQIIEDEGYFLSGLRYIHQNSLKTGVVRHRTVHYPIRLLPAISWVGLFFVKVYYPKLEKTRFCGSYFRKF